MSLSADWEKLIVENDQHRRSHLYGKYRGIVTDNQDDQRMGRIKARVPAVLGDLAVWCVPVVPFAGDAHGLFMIPKVGDGVWVEFEAGDVSRPLWTGSWWAKGEIPPPDAVDQHVLTTPKGLQVVLDDAGKKLLLKHPDGAEISMTSTSITI